MGFSIMASVKVDDLGLIPGTHRMEENQLLQVTQGENQLLQVTHSLPLELWLQVQTHSHE